MPSKKAPTTPVNKKRQRPSDEGHGKAGEVGRMGRPAVEDPVATSPVIRQAHKPRLDLILRVRTTYRCAIGTRRHALMVERRAEQVDAAQSLRRAEAVRQGLVEPLSPKTVAVILAAQRTSNNANGAHGAHGLPLVRRTQWMIVPEFLSEDLWERHGYSLSDIRKTLDAFPTRVVWQLARSYNCPATNAAARIYCETDLLPTFGSKPTAVGKLLAILRDRHPEWAGRQSITWNMSKVDDPNGDGLVYEAYDRHVPGLPVHRVRSAAFESLVANIALAPTTLAAGIDPVSSSSSSSSSTSSFLGGGGGATQFHKTARTIFAWRGILAVPIELNAAANMLLMGRVIPWQSYVQFFGLPRALRSCPNVVVAADGYYALMNEQFYFYCPDSLVAASLAVKLDSSSRPTAAPQPPSKPPAKRPHTAS